MQTENRLQQECFLWLWNEKPETRGLYFEINNNPRNKIDGAKRKAIGMIKGVADNCILWCNTVYFFEFKTEKGSLSPAQVQWSNTIKSKYYSYFVIRSFEEFKDVIDSRIILPF